MKKVRYLLVEGGRVSCRRSLRGGQLAKKDKSFVIVESDDACRVQFTR